MVNKAGFYCAGFIWIWQTCTKSKFSSSSDIPGLSQPFAIIGVTVLRATTAHGKHKTNLLGY
jgi:hypothetical protein